MSSEFSSIGVNGEQDDFLGQDDLTSRTDNASDPRLQMENYNALKAVEAQTPPPLTADNIAYMRQWEENQKANTPGENGIAELGETQQRAELEKQQDAEIEALAARALEIGPDYAANTENELKQSAGEILKMKIESKIYDVLTAVEKKIGQSIVTQKIREGFAWDLWIARDYKAGKLTGLDRGEQRRIAREYERDVAIGKRNIGNRTEEVRFTPSGEMLPSTGYYGRPLVAERPTADHQIHTTLERSNADRVVSPYSSRVMISAMTAQTAIEYNPVINKLEEWRANIRARQENARGAAQLVGAYGGATTGA